MNLLEQLDQRRRDAEAKQKEAEAAADAARDEQKQLESDREKLMEAAALAAKFGYTFAPVPTNGKIVLSPELVALKPPPEAPPPVAKQELMPNLLPEGDGVPLDKEVKSQGEQPGRRVKHASPSKVLDFPFPLKMRSLLHVLLGCRYVEPLNADDQQFQLAEPATVLHVEEPKDITGPDLVSVAYLSTAVKMPYEWLIVTLTAMSRLLTTIRLIEPYQANRWRFTELGQRLYREMNLENIAQMARLYSTFFTPFVIKKMQKAKAVHAGMQVKINDRAVYEAHRELNLMVTIHRYPITAEEALARLDRKGSVSRAEINRETATVHATQD